MDNKTKRRRGDIIWVDLGQHPGSHIQSGRRVCLIVNTDKSNAAVYTVMPGTSKIAKKDFPVHVLVKPQEVCGRLPADTVFMAEQLVTVDERQILLKTGHIEKTSDAMKRVNKILIRQMELEV